MQRLVYAPRVNAWIKGDAGVVDVSKFIVAGSVDRKVNQVSSAALTLRNPIVTGADGVPRKLFTECPYTDPVTGTSVIQPMFHPMDPIIISLTRLNNHEIQVFTGYCDSTPYLQLYPGICQIEASCTLKRLLHTYWDPGLPFTWQFLAQFGWLINPASGGLMNPGQDFGGGTVGQGNKITDTGFGQLLFAVLTEPRLGGWPKDNVWIENIPIDTVVQKVSKLYEQSINRNTAAQQDLEAFLRAMIGTASQGGGGPTGPVPTGTQQEVIQKSADAFRISAQTLWGVYGTETDFGRNISTSSAGAEGPFQFIPSTADTYVPGGRANVQNFNDSAYGAAHYLSALGASTDPQSSQTIKALNDYNGNGGGTSLTSYASSVIEKGKSWVPPKDKGKGSSNGSGSNGSGSGGFFGGTTGVFGSSNPVNSGTKPPKGAKGGSNSFVFPMPKGVGVDQSSWSFDQGVDIATNNSACGSDAPLLAVESGKVKYVGPPTTAGFTNGWGIPILYGDSGNVYYYGHAGANGQVNNGNGGKVQAGQKIGEVGCGIVGQSSGPHLEIGLADSNGAPLGNQTAHQMGKMLATGQVETSPTGPDSGGGGANADSAMVDARAAAFSSYLDLQLMDPESLALTGDKSLMNDQPLFPFIEQLTKASLRNFQSMPNGNFFAFFPDYFGGLNHRTPYWQIEDIEILDGQIQLSDDALSTHVYTVGDIANFDGINIVDKIQSSGVVTVFNAFMADFLNFTPAPTPGAGANSRNSVTAPSDGKNSKTKAKPTPFDPNNPSLADRDRAIAFLVKYGARPYYEPVPQIRSTIYESFYAYQTFMLMWSRQFLTTFTFTFMPELFPGGIVAFPNHGIQCYIDEVTHNFDYTNGFTTSASLSAPTALPNSDRKNIHAGMIRAFPGYDGTPTAEMSTGSANSVTANSDSVK